MLLRWRQGAVTLEAPENFKAFKVVVESDAAQLSAVTPGFAGVATFADAQTAWVSQAALRAWPGLQADAAWLQGLDAMVAKARPFGWIDEASGAIRAHVEWAGAAPT
ncbi:MAG: hypothetical protein ABI574_00380 [Burkholderiales bacterium]